MAIQNLGNEQGAVTASTDLSATEYRFIKVTGTFTVADCGAGERSIGIRNNAPESGKSVSYVNSGLAKLTIGSGGCSAGDILKSDANGGGVVANIDKDYYGAIAMEAGAENEVISVTVAKGYAGI